MKTIREVTEITGLTRKALRGYDEVGLIHPTEKAASGKWLYDDAAIVELLAIDTYAEAGYTRKEIKEILAKPEEEAKAVQEELISKLEKKKRRLEGMINMIRLNNFILSLPENVFNTYLSIGLLTILEGKLGKNYKDSYSEMVDGCADSEEYDLFNVKMGSLICAYMIFLGRVKTDDPAHKEVQWYVSSLFDRYYAEVKKFSEQYGEDTDEARTYNFLANLLDNILHDPEEREMYDLYCKPGYEVFIMKAVDEYMQNKDNNKA